MFNDPGLDKTGLDRRPWAWLDVKPKHVHTINDQMEQILMK